MDFNDWIYEIIKSGNLCYGYDQKVNSSTSDEDLMKIVLDANGINFLCEMQRKGIPLPYEVITSRFAPYINGNYVAEYRNNKNNGYNSSLYCCYPENEIRITTTCCCILGYTGTVIIAENNFCELYLDENTDVQIKCEPNGKAIVHYWSEYSPKVESAEKGVTLIKE